MRISPAVTTDIVPLALAALVKTFFSQRAAVIAARPPPLFVGQRLVLS